MINQNYTISIIIAALIILSPLYANADPLQASIWIPEKLLLGQPYYGVVIVDQNLESDVEFAIVTDNEEIIEILSDKITIPKGKHHGIIKLQTKGTGEAKIFGIHKDTLLEKSLQVVESASTATQLDVITPTSIIDVLSGKNAKYVGYAFLKNDFDKPVVAKESVPITLTSNGDILLSKNSIIISPGNHYAKFSFETRGEGSITATAPNLDPDESTISISDPSEIELRLEVAPKPIPTSSSAEIYYWLERDGKPYLPAHDVKITIIIDKSTNLSFDAVTKGAMVLSSSTTDRKSTDPDAKKIITRTDVQLQRDSTKEFVLEKGNYYGKATIYSSFDEAGSINISGLAESINPKKDEETIKVTKVLTVDTDKSNTDKVTKTRVFALPDPAYDKVEIIVSSSSDNGPALEQDDEEFTVFVDNKLSLITQSGKIKADENYGILVADVKDIGNSEIFAQRNEAEGEEIQLQVAAKYVKNPEINIVKLPVIFGTQQDLMIISSSQDRIITNPNSTGNLISITSRPAFDYQVINDNTSILTVKGKITNLLDEDPIVHVASNAFTTTETLDVYNPNRNRIESMHPSTVYAGEAFPLINYITDLEGNPMMKADLKMSSGVEMGKIDDLVYFNQSGTHGIIFYDKNTVPIESTIVVSGIVPPIAEQQIQQITAPSPPPVFTYQITVVNGQGSGTYPEGTNVTISAPETIDDMYIIKKKLVGWENLPYKEATVTFQADFDVETKPIYQQDLTMLFLAGGGGAGLGSVFVLKKKRKNTKKDDNNMSAEDKIIDELLEK